MVTKDAWNDFSFFELTKARFMAQDVIYPGEVSMCAWEKGERGGDICLLISDSHCCTAETNTTL